VYLASVFGVLGGKHVASGQYSLVQMLQAGVPMGVNELWRESALEMKKFGEVQAKVVPDKNITSLDWTRKSIVQTQVHIWDRSLWDGEKYTVRKYLKEQRDRYGGVDAVLLWHTYPQVGIDEKTQYEMALSLPNGGYSEVVEAFHKEGVRVLYNYIPWDQVNDVPSMASPETILAKYLDQFGFDGYNCDTCFDIPATFWNATKKAGQPEGGGTVSTSSWTPLGWGYYGYAMGAFGQQLYGIQPGIVKLKYIDETGRYLSTVTDRWGTNRIPGVQYALFNGVGYNAWENVWGIFNNITDRDAEAIKQFALVSRFLSQNNYTSNFKPFGWSPYSKRLTSNGAASQFQHVDGSIAWTIVNLEQQLFGNNQGVLNVTDLEGRFYDLYKGERIFPKDGLLTFQLEFFGSVLYTKSSPRGLGYLLKKMRGRPSLRSLNAKWHPMEQEYIGRSTTKFNTHHKHELNRSMVLVPVNPAYDFKVAGIELEGGCDENYDPHDVCCGENLPHVNNQCGIVPHKDVSGVDVQFPWETDRPRRNHELKMKIGPFLMDKYPVTRAQYKRFLNVTNYRPKDTTNFLKGWAANWTVPIGTENIPVTSISLREAKAYCKWLNKRLPHSYEWQYAAQGYNNYLYPWGNKDDPTRYPHIITSNKGKPIIPDQVDAHRNGSSPFGIEDMVGNVWQFTSELEDAHTRNVILRGGSRYRPKVDVYKAPSPQQYYNYYFQSTVRLDWHNKFMLMSDSMDRQTTVGFRCLQDVPSGQPAPYQYTPAPY